MVTPPEPEISISKTEAFLPGCEGEDENMPGRIPTKKLLNILKKEGFRVQSWVYEGPSAEIGCRPAGLREKELKLHSV